MESSRWLEHAGARMPFVTRIRKAAYDREFEHNSEQNLFRGVFSTFEEAQASAPRSRPLGYDNTESANLYLKRLFVDDHDYPSMFWLSLSFAEGMRRVTDIGGAVGIKDLCLRQVHRLSAGAALAGDRCSGRRRARPGVRRKPPGRPGARILRSAGRRRRHGRHLRVRGAAVPAAIAARLARDARPQAAPHHHQHDADPSVESFYTLNSIGTAYCPYRVQAREPLIAAVEGYGYRAQGRMAEYRQADADSTRAGRTALRITPVSASISVGDVRSARPCSAAPRAAGRPFGENRVEDRARWVAGRVGRVRHAVERHDQSHPLGQRPADTVPVPGALRDAMLNLLFYVPFGVLVAISAVPTEGRCRMARRFRSSPSSSRCSRTRGLLRSRTW